MLERHFFISAKYPVCAIFTKNDHAENPVKIAILSRDKTLYSTRRLVEAAAARGHEVRVIDYLRCYMNITADQPSIQYKGQPGS